MYKLAALVDAHAETLATIETWDNGKPYSVALNEDVAEVAGTLRYYAGYADKVHGQVINTGPDKLAYTLREPVGVCGQIIPWNYPLAMMAWKVGPALACGNTVVLKAAEQTPLSILYFATLVKEAGFPPGVVNLLNGYGNDGGAAIASHVDVDKIAFTGSTATGKQIMKMASVNMKSITLETGGKSPLLVFADADLEQAVKWSHVGIMSNMGQICTATSRILVQEEVYEKFVEMFKEQVKSVSKVGDPFKDETFQGPQVTKAQYERVLGYIESGKSEGATLATGGEAYKDVDGKGFFISPTVFTNVKDSMKIYREEVFGPFAVIASFKTEDEAVEMANDTTYGLGSAVFTENLTKAHRVAKNIEAGMVWINSSNDSDFRIPFGVNSFPYNVRRLSTNNACRVSSRAVSVGSSAKLVWPRIPTQRQSMSTWVPGCRISSINHMAHTSMHRACVFLGLPVQFDACATWNVLSNGTKTRISSSDKFQKSTSKLISYHLNGEQRQKESPI